MNCNLSWDLKRRVQVRDNNRNKGKRECWLDDYQARRVTLLPRPRSYDSAGLIAMVDIADKITVLWDPLMTGIGEQGSEEIDFL